jgi:creatinine amidohydrolase
LGSGTWIWLAGDAGLASLVGACDKWSIVPHGDSDAVPVRFGDLTYEEISELATAGAIAVVPTGCTEQQGPHLTVDFDTWFAESLMVEAAERIADELRVVVLPALPFGPTPEHRAFGAGFIDIPVATFDQVIRSIVDSVADQGFGRILLWRGCGGHDLQAVAHEFNSAHVEARTFLPAHPFHDIWCRIADTTVPGGHADSFTTSIVMHRRPERLRPDRVPSQPSATPDWGNPKLDFARYSTTGVIGSAAHASAALGAQLWQECVAAAAKLLRRIDHEPDTVGIEPTM